jgi:hypothetical protein
MPNSARHSFFCLIAVMLAGGCQLGKEDPNDRFSAADGNGRIVAEGRPPLTFSYPGTGRVILRDLDSREIVFSMESPLNPGPQNAALLVIDEERRALVARENVNGKTVDTPLVGIDPKHRYRMIYLPAVASGK